VLLSVRMNCLRLDALDISEQLASNCLTGPILYCVGCEYICLMPDCAVYPGREQVWAGPLSGGGVAVAFVNKGQEQASMMVANWQTLRLPQQGYYDVKNVWMVSTSVQYCIVSLLSLRHWRSRSNMT